MVNDYYYFKALTGAQSIKGINMREHDNGYNIQSRINIGGIEVPFDIRFIGDNYYDSNWEKDMVNRRVNYTLKNDIIINIPNNSDELYSLIYHIIIQKPNPENSKHIPRVQELLKANGGNVLNFNNYKYVRFFLEEFMKENGYIYKKPYDKKVGFRV